MVDQCSQCSQCLTCSLLWPRPQALMLTYHHLLSPPRLAGRGLEAPAEGGGAVTAVGGAEREEGVARGEETDVEFPRPSDDSTETADGPIALHHRGYHGNEAGLELGL